MRWVLWIAFVVAACGDEHPLAGAPPTDSAPDAPAPVVLDNPLGGEAIFEDPAGNTLMDIRFPATGTFSVDMPQGGTVVVIDGGMCTEPTPLGEQVCYGYVFAVRGVKPGDHISGPTNASSTISDNPGSPDALTTGCSAGWDMAPKVTMQVDYDIVVEDPASGPATIPTFGPGHGCSQYDYDAYCHGYTPPTICAPP